MEPRFNNTTEQSYYFQLRPWLHTVEQLHKPEWTKVLVVFHFICCQMRWTQNVFSSIFVHLTKVGGWGMFQIRLEIILSQTCY